MEVDEDLLTLALMPLPRPYPWPAGYGGLTHIERVSLEGEKARKTPDFARTMAIAAALQAHRWEEPFVKEEWIEETERELEEMMEEQAGAENEEFDGSSEEDSSEEDQDEEDGQEHDHQRQEMDVDGDEGSPERQPIWPEGVVGLI